MRSEFSNRIHYFAEHSERAKTQEEEMGTEVTAAAAAASGETRES